MSSNPKQNCDPPGAELPEGSPAVAKAGPSGKPQGGLVVVLQTENEQSGSAAVVVRSRMVDRQTQAAIGRQLKTLYDSVAAAPVPERFLELLAQLERKGSKS